MLGMSICLPEHTDDNRIYGGKPYLEMAHVEGCRGGLDYASIRRIVDIRVTQSTLGLPT